MRGRIVKNKSLSKREMWEKVYEKSSTSDLYVKPGVRCGTYELLCVFRRFLGDGQGKHVLEMGCGGSKYLPWLAKELKFSVNGIDYTESGCAAARFALESAGVNGHIHQLDFMSVDRSLHGSFDAVISCGVVEHFSDTADVLRRFTECLRDEGTIITYVPNMMGIFGSLIKRVNVDLYNTHHLFDLSHFRDAHLNAGVRVEYARYHE